MPSQQSRWVLPVLGAQVKPREPRPDLLDSVKSRFDVLALERAQDLEPVCPGRLLLLIRQHSEPPITRVFLQGITVQVAVTEKGPLKRDASVGTVDQIDDKPVAFLHVDHLVVSLVRGDSQNVVAGLEGLRPAIHLTRLGDVDGFLANRTEVGIEDLIAQLLLDCAP